jgi:Ser/Thr protein kinase RdoA (MazF antagonist)
MGNCSVAIEAAGLDAYALAPTVELFPLIQGNSTQNYGVRTAVGNFVLRTHNDAAPAIQYEHELLHWLAENDLSFAVPVPIPTCTGATMIQTPQGWRSLSVMLPGSRVDWRSLEQVEKFGSALGELHSALSYYPALSRPGASPLSQLLQAHPWLSEPHALAPSHSGLLPSSDSERLFAWWRNELIELDTLIESRYQDLPQQIIHHDYIPNNVLVKVDHITAVLDFEFATYDARVLDVAIALRNMLRLWENRSPWLTTRHFCMGYRRRIRLNKEEVAAVAWLIRLRNVSLILGRRAQATGDAKAFLQLIQYAHEVAQWLEVYEQHLIDELARTN